MENNVNVSSNIENTEFMKSVNWIITTHKIFGIIAIIQGVFSCLSIVGIIVGIPSILAGIKLMDSSKSLNNYKLMNDTKSLKNFFIEYKNYWIIILITMLVSIILVILSFIVFAGMVTALIQALHSNM